MTKTKTTSIRIGRETNERIKQISRELAAIERKEVPAGEIVSRIVNAPDIRERLKIGSEQRRRFS